MSFLKHVVCFNHYANPEQKPHAVLRSMLFNPNEEAEEAKWPSQSQKPVSQKRFL